MEKSFLTHIKDKLDSFTLPIPANSKPHFFKHYPVYFLLISGLLFFFQMYFSFQSVNKIDWKIIIAISYTLISIITFLMRKNIQPYHLVIIVILAISYRIITISYSYHLPIPQNILLKTEWQSFFYLKSLHYAKTYYPLFNIGSIVLEILMVLFAYLIMRKRQVNWGLLLLYLWNPFIILQFYSTWNPLIIWQFFLLLTGMLIYYNRNFVASFALGFTIGFYDPSCWLILPAVRKLHIYIVVSIAIFAGIFFIQDHLLFLVSRTLFSNWLQQAFTFFGNLFMAKGSVLETHYQFIFNLSLILCLTIWMILNDKTFFDKVYWVLFLMILTNPNWFNAIPGLMIILAVIYQNWSLIVFSIYIYVKPVLINLGWGFVIEYDLYIQYGILIFCSILTVIISIIVKSKSRT